MFTDVFLMSSLAAVTTGVILGYVFARKSDSRILHDTFSIGFKAGQEVTKTMVEQQITLAREQVESDPEMADLVDKLKGKQSKPPMGFKLGGKS